MRPIHGLCGAAGDGRWAGRTRRWANRGCKCSARPRKRPKWLVVRQHRSTKGASGKWLEELGVCVRAGVWEGPREVAAEAGDDNGVYMSQGRQGRQGLYGCCTTWWWKEPSDMI